jgi:predicted nuclease of restriction endonuclease-like (RecB) superfamily
MKKPTPQVVKKRLQAPKPKAKVPAAQEAVTLVDDLHDLILSCRTALAQQVNSGLVMLYWLVGERLNRDLLPDGKRAAYGQQIVDAAGAALAAAHGQGFTAKNLRRMMQFASIYPNREIVVTLSRLLSWSHLFALLPLKDANARAYYARVAGEERWSVRHLRQRIEAKEYERPALATLRQGSPESAFRVPTGDIAALTPALVFKDPYLLDFLGLPPGYNERDLETAILRELERFILELGRGFAFVERQKRLIIDGEDFYIDLLFFHRRLRRLVAVDLKLGRFKAAHKGQMELYLRWLDKHERQPGEDPPLGLILCAEASHEQIELLEMHQDGIMVAEYWTELMPKKELAQRLHQALIEARERLAAQGILEAGEAEDEEVAK